MPIPAVPGSWQRSAGRMRYLAGKGIRFAAQVRPAAAVAMLLAAASAVVTCGSAGPGRSASPRAQAGTSVPVQASSPAHPSHQETTTRIRLIVGGAQATATLRDNATAGDFASLLPLTLHMHDLFGREKPGSLPRPLAAGGQPQATYQVGQLGYWAPSDDLAIYYRDEGQQIPPPGIVIIGQIDSGLEAIAAAGDDFQLTIEPAG